MDGVKSYDGLKATKRTQTNFDVQQLKQATKVTILNAKNYWVKHLNFVSLDEDDEQTERF